MKNTIKSSLQFIGCSMVLGSLLLTSCSRETFSNETLEPTDSQEFDISLRTPSSDLIIIDDLGTDARKTTEAPGVDRGRFNITLSYLLPPTPRQQEVFEAAAARWERIIIKDEPSFTGTLPSAFQGLPPLVDEGVVDDIIIEVVLAPIDGSGGILGQAGPQFVRSDDFLTLSGVMFFDVADLDFLEELDLFEEVIVHEMGHVLGIGTLWNTVPFGFDRTLRGGDDSNPYFLGKKANVFWNAEGGTLELPVEGDFGPGTALGHWDEEVLNNELMTGFLNLGENPLSRITAGSMKDLGYGAASVGESYDLPKGSPGVAAKSNPTGLHIGSMETLLQPIGIVNMKK
ncbi:leishmanolysin-related zinc metalloendopeptidase [Maribacter confluentis]|uniref:Leishmanolysin-related zinc metalloendopeptidase n=1 Tax=Maribacter confluentis TaxID=1656093 RepID=A0ABT8RKY2_9FLAO|nr:leishmanolysin-related zinc metalloendopeptidase [Maribacter confluentis]MDO1511122.1 leishmanolysin-related zinc metalloendopeptidase [Maribacter confluentis]